VLPKKIFYVLNIVFFSNIPSKEARVRLTYCGAGPIRVTDVPAGHFLTFIQVILLIYIKPLNEIYVFLKNCHANTILYC
jgi:hypothetical protein